MKLLSLFSGIGAFERALENLGIDFELVNYCEIDRYASKSFALLHGVSEDLNLHDVTKIDTSTLPKDIDLVTYGFPCQDISLAGRQKGLEHNGDKTRSGLVWDAHRIIGGVQPKVAICENVKNLTSKKFTKEFKAILDNLQDMGYNNYYQVLNSKHYGIPQNRERVFIISIRKDIDLGSFIFPSKQHLKFHLADIIENDTEDTFITKIENPTLKMNYIQYDNSGKGYDSQTSRLYFLDSISPTLNASHPFKIIYKYKTQVNKENLKDVLNTENLVRNANIYELFTLMGFTKEDAKKLKNYGISKTQIIKQAGNSIVVNVLEEIFKNLEGVLYEKS